MAGRKIRRLDTDELAVVANNLDTYSEGEVGYDSDLDGSYVANTSSGEDTDSSLIRSLELNKKLSQQKRKRKKTISKQLVSHLVQASQTEPVAGPSGTSNVNNSCLPLLNNDDDSDSDLSDTSIEGNIDKELPSPEYLLDNIEWTSSLENFNPKFEFPSERRGKPKATSVTKPIEIFHSIFTRDLFEHIAFCTNERIQMDWNNKPAKKKQSCCKKTTGGEIQTMFAITIIMGYNKLPDFHCYWSTSEALGNSVIKKSMSRDRFCYLHSRMYTNPPVKPANASKVYYLEHLVETLLPNFRSAYSDSSHQSIDEAMVGFKGRSALKQYMPLKPVKRGIKLWQRNYALTGYTYDLGIYSGRAGMYKT